MATQAIPAQRWVRIIPAAFLMYTIAFMDRNNIAFGFFGMQKDLQIGATASGIAAGIFFFGYLFLQVPGAWLAERWSAKRFITAALLVWGVTSMATALVQNLTQLLIVRFVLGVVEGGVSPATMILLTKWFPLSERSRANALWYLCIPAASIVTGPVSGWILTHYDWRVLFALEGAPALIWAAIWWWLIDDSPHEAAWITPAERDYLETTLASERKTIAAETPSLRDVLRNRNVILLLVLFCFLQVGFYGYGLWLPTIVKALSQGTIMQVGWISAIPWICAMIGSLLISARADRTRDYKTHIAGPILLGALFLALSVWAGPARPVLAIGALSLCLGFMYCYAVYWAALSAFVAADVLAVAMGTINAIGNLGGFFGPFIVGALIQRTGTPVVGEAFLIGCLVISGLVALQLRNRDAPRPSATAQSNTVAAH
ncbi:MAG TPA: MFS transporter [Acetobacteraceae bacterium]|nr:MFS transporter [Acetobacteraceae bacterium]